MQYKYLADKDLTARSSFPWFILRPSWLSDAPGTGKASIGRTHLYPLLSVRVNFLAYIALTLVNGFITRGIHDEPDMTCDLQRDDLAEVIKTVIEIPDAKGLAMDIVGGEEPIAEGVKRFVKKGVSDWLD